MKTKTRIILILLVVAIAGVIAYQYPIQKALASKSFEEYISQQGVPADVIVTKEMVKDWKQGGYLIVVTFNDDSDNTYYYHYEPWTHRRGEELKFNRMTLNIVDNKNSVELDYPYDGCKYPPL